MNIDDDDGLEAPPKRPPAWGLRRKNKEVLRETIPQAVRFGREPGQMCEYGWYDQQIENEILSYLTRIPYSTRDQAITFVLNNT